MSLDLQRVDCQQEHHGSDPTSSRFDGGRIQKTVTLEGGDSGKGPKATLDQDKQDLGQIVDLIPQAIIVLNPDGKAVYANRVALEYTGLSLDEVQAGNFRDRVFHPQDIERLREMREKALYGTVPFDNEQRARRKDGRYRWFLIQYSPLLGENEKVVRWYATGTDIEDRKQAETLRVAEKRALEMIADGASLRAVLDQLCSFIDAQVAPSVTTILLTDADGRFLYHGGGPRVPAEWISAIVPVPVAFDAGLCGTAAFLKARVVVPDVSTEKNWRDQYRDLALRNGIRAAWSEPILTKNNEVLGTFALYSQESRVPAEDELALVQGAGRIALIAIERQRAQAALAKAHDELESERDRLRLLVEVQKTLVTNLDLRSLLTGLTASLRRVTECDFVGLALPDLSSEELRQHFACYLEGRGTVREGMTIPLQGTASGKAFRTRQLVCLNNVKAEHPDPEIYDTREGQEFYQLVSLNQGVPSGYFLPLIRGTEVIAVLQLTKHGRKPLKPQEAEFLSALAGQLSAAVANVLEHAALVASRERLASEQVYLREEVVRSSMFEEIVGSSKALSEIQSQISQVAPTDSTVLIQGETGTGKELIARAIHNRSKRANRAFICVNCAVISPSLIASELFGHEKGAFTGAVQRRLGRFESADGGTIFLDEVGELPSEMQTSLLRVLQEREFERVGGNHSIHVDVRVLAATNKDLDSAVSDGSFRKDLFYRLNVFPIQVPTLRERVDDIPLLVEYLVDRYAKKAGKRIRSISKRTLQLFQSYDWPGNVRELQNVIERAVIVCEGEIFQVDASWLKPIVPFAKANVTFAADIAEREKAMIENALRVSNGIVSGPGGAAAKLGLPRQTLESKIRKLRINRYRYKTP
jgi:formate hydrogenlyase transcriptional activator